VRPDWAHPATTLRGWSGKAVLTDQTYRPASWAEGMLTVTKIAQYHRTCSDANETQWLGHVDGAFI